MKRAIAMLLIVSVASLVAQDKGDQSAGRFSGLMFGDYFYDLQRDAGIGSQSNVALPGTTAMQGFQFRRIYFTYDHDIAKQFTTRFRLEADQSANTSNGKIGVFVKDAYFKWKNIFSGSDLTFGIQQTPLFEVSEASWGFRAIEKTIMDLRGIYGARDVGVSLRGSVTAAGSVNYWVMIGKNAGNSPATSKYNRYSAHLEVKPATNLQATVYVDYTARAERTDPFSAGSTVSNGSTTAAVYVGYAEPARFSAGVEGFTSMRANGYVAPGARTLSSLATVGFSAWASFTLVQDIAVLGRYDFFDPNSDATARGDSRNYLMGGVAWKPHKNVSIIPNILYETYERLASGKALDASVTGRITLYYVFL